MGKIYILFLIGLIHSPLLFSQKADTIKLLVDSQRIQSSRDTILANDSIRKIQTDSSLVGAAGTGMKAPINETPKNVETKSPEELPVKSRKQNDKDLIFYMLAGLLFLLGIIRTAYSRYFTNMFRVFFNSSLRQSQLTDQLSQDTYPSLFLNALFVLTAGFYFYLVVQRQGVIADELNGTLLGLSIAAILIMYTVKFFTLKFIGWVTGYRTEADSYIFIIFLINKIIGICLLPVIIVLAFADRPVVSIFLITSIIIIALMLLLRFFRSYGLLQHRLRVSRFHFLLYIFSLELLPILLIYKGVSSFLINYL